jgi:hypothetical protein
MPPNTTSSGVDLARSPDAEAIRTATEDDYIHCPKCKNSLSAFMAKAPDGCEDGVIAKLLMMTEAEVEAIYAAAAAVLRKKVVDKNLENR